MELANASRKDSGRRMENGPSSTETEDKLWIKGRDYRPMAFTPFTYSEKEAIFSTLTTLGIQTPWM
jgi:hypothetical protein